MTGKSPVGASRSRGLILLLLGGGVLAGPLVPGPSLASVVINEVSYHPPKPGSGTLEYIELYNNSGQEISIGGWRFVEGVEYEFPEGVRIPARGFVVVCRNLKEFSSLFRLSGEGVFGDFSGSLSNGGEELVLTDAFDAVIDAVRYDDEAPWSETADGGGAALQRLCPDGDSNSAANWSGEPGEPPTPLATNIRTVCPPPVRVPPVVITEIHYHAEADNDPLEEYVELHNPGPDEVQVGGWKFTDGIEFELPEGTAIGAGEYLVVCRHRDYIRDVFGVTNTVGNFIGQLSNGGERLALVDAEERVVDVVRYRDSGKWSPAADGQGRSLEKVVSTGPSDDPANWTHSVPVPSASEFVRLEVIGPLPDLFQQKVVLGIDGPGEFVVDNVVLEPVAEPGRNLVENGDFERGLDGWVPRGNADQSEVLENIGVGGSRGLRLISTAFCPVLSDCPSSESVAFSFQTGGLDIMADYRLSLDCRYVTGSTGFYGRMLRGMGVPAGHMSLTPGRENSTAQDRLPPSLSHRGRFPEEPTSVDPVWISARVRPGGSEQPPTVTLTYSVSGSEQTVELLDDGTGKDSFAGDGVYGVELPPVDHNSEVLYRLAVEGDTGQVSSPFSLTGVFEPQEIWGYYVNDNQPDSALPVYHVLISGVDPSDPKAINDALNCSTLGLGSFAFRGELYPRVGLRFRGNTMCVVDKRNLKVRFNCGNYFRGLRKINLQSMWTDKALVREHLAWDFVAGVGAPYCETEYLRLHLNGEYHGLFLYLEHPDRRFLDRNGLDADGCLYKAKQPERPGPGEPPPIGVENPSDPSEFPDLWEEETCEDGDFSDVAEFIGSMHADATGPGGPTAEFMQDRVFEEMLIDYQVSQVVLNNIDSFAKNHFLYGDPSEDPPRWGFIMWDLDLVFGKYFDPEAVGPGRQVGILNDCMLSPGGDLNPWFAASVLGNLRLNYFVDFFFRAGGDHYQRAYLVRLWDVLREKYTNEVYDPRLDALQAFLATEQKEDIARWGRYPSNPGCEVPPDMSFHIQQIKEQIGLHRVFLVNYMRRNHSEVIDHDRMKITEVMYSPEDADEDLEFVELLNTSGRQIDVSGWRLTEGIEYTFREGTVLEPEEVILVVRSRNDFSRRYPEVVATRRVLGDYRRRLANEGERLRLVDAGEGHPATVDFLNYGADDPWPEMRDGHSIELTQVEPNRDNDRAANWASSRVLGGTPGVIGNPLAPFFLRADADSDGEVSLTDAVYVLLFLFQGGERPACMDAADADDDGQVQLNDAIAVLAYLFQGGAVPPPPHPERGADPTPDNLEACVESEF